MRQIHGHRMNRIEGLLLDVEIISKIKNRKFKQLTRYYDYLDKNVAEQPEETDPALQALSKVDQLKVKYKTIHSK